jgi:hypothetical protein
MTETPNGTPAESDYFDLNEDPSLKMEAERDEHFGILLTGYGMAQDIAARAPENPAYQAVCMAAREGVLSWIERNEYARTLLSAWPPEE